MVERRLQQIEGNLHSIGNFRRRALAEDNERQAAQAEESIIHLEREVAALLSKLEQPRREESEERREHARMERQHILTINGDPDFLNMMRSLLQDERYNVTTTNFVPKSFDMIDALRPALLIIDLAIGEQAGWDLLERLHLAAATRGIPVIAVSEDPEQLKRIRWDEERYGTQRKLRKPLNLHELLAEIDELIGRA